MKACVLHAVGDLRVEEVPTPSPKEGEVLVSIRAAGVCGSDIPRVFEKGTYHFPTIPGHEFAGEIAETGAGVVPQLKGRKAAVFPLLPCFKCIYCQVGEYAQCVDYNYFGSRCDGGFAEYIAVPAWNLVLVPDSLSYDEAAMLEPAAVAAHALRQVGVDIGDSIAIFGAGPIGLMIGMWAKIWGAGRVMLIDIDDRRADFARRLGFSDTICARTLDVVDWVNQIVPGGVDVSVEGSGSSVALEQCVEITRRSGRVVLMGNPIGSMGLSQKAYSNVLRKQLTIRGSWNSSYSEIPRNEWKLAAAFMASGKLPVRQLVTHRVSLDQLRSAMETMRDRSAFVSKVLYVRS